MSKLVNPGEKPPRPGEYRERGSNGGAVPHPRQDTIKPSTPKMPPTQAPKHTWERVGPPKKS